MNKKYFVHAIFDADSHTITYIVWDKATKKSAVIDSVLDYNHKNVSTSTKTANKVIAYIQENNLENEWILETHMHADHITASTYLKEKIGGKKAIGSAIVGIQKYLKHTFDLNDTFKTDGSQFDHLFTDNEIFFIGSLKVRALHTPGHTPADMIYSLDDALFTGDTLFAPDIGTARCDFPGGSAEMLYDSIRKILTSFPDDVKLYLCHDYPEGKGRELLSVTTIGKERTDNIHIRDGVSKEEFVTLCTARDKTLDLPSYFFPAIQINSNAGRIISGEYIKLIYTEKNKLSIKNKALD